MSDHTPASAGKLVDVLGESNTRIEIETGSAFDLTGYTLPDFGDGIELVSGDSFDEGPGATLRYTEQIDGSAFTARGDDFTARGIEFAGPVHDQTPLDRDAETVGLHCWGENVTIDRCSFHGWPVAGFRIGGINPWRETQATVTNSSFHHNMMDGYGYGAYITNGRMEIDACEFDWNRHSIASTGRPSTHYHVHDSWFGRHTVHHVIDVHGRERDDGPPVAGGETIIGPRNTIEATRGLGETGKDGSPQEAVKIRGVPAKGALIYQCRFAHSEPPKGAGGDGQAIYQEGVDEFDGVFAIDNQYGPA